jgi:hypothetical protein
MQDGDSSSTNSGQTFPAFLFDFANCDQDIGVGTIASEKDSKDSNACLCS